MVASDPICFAGFAKEYYSFNNYEYAHIENGEIKFFDENGEEVALAPGQTFISAVPEYGGVEY